MSGVKRVFVEKKKPFAVNAKELLEEIGGYLGIKTITDVRVLIRYDIENLSDRKSTRLNSSHKTESRMPSSA